MKETLFRGNDRKAASPTESARQGRRSGAAADEVDSGGSVREHLGADRLKEE